MVQHMLLVFGAAPAIVLAAPITLLLRVATPASSRPLDPARAPLAGRQGDRPSARGLAAVHGRHVGEPRLAALRRGAGGPAAPRPRARPLPGDCAPVLVARRRARPQPMAPAVPGARLLPVPPDAPQLPARGRDPLLGAGPLPALRDDRAAVAALAPGGPAARRRDHVGRGRRRVPGCDPAGDRGLDAPRRGGDAPARGRGGCPGSRRQAPAVGSRRPRVPAAQAEGIGASR